MFGEVCFVIFEVIDKWYNVKELKYVFRYEDKVS